MSNNILVPKLKMFQANRGQATAGGGGAAHTKFQLSLRKNHLKNLLS
jgi:hypothetical protein